MKRSTWHLGGGAVVAGWLLALVVVSATSLLGRGGDLAPWLIVHLLLLGAVSNAILIWSSYFSEALLRLPSRSSRRGEAARLVLFNLGAFIVVVAMARAWWGALWVGAALAAAAAWWHAVMLLIRLRRSLPARFGVTVRYYVVAAALLPFGVWLGVMLASDDLDEAVHARIALAHVGINLLGWMGLTVVGTLVTLWPSMLHTRVADGAEQAARRALPILLAGLLLLAGGALVGSRVLAVVGIVGYVGGLAVVARPFALEARHRPPTTYATWSVLAGSSWLAASVIALAVIVASATGWEQAADSADRLAAPLLVGFAAQTLLGALSYLLPVVLGGGPTISRATTAILDTAARPRVAIINTGIVAAALPLPPEVRTAIAVVVLGALAMVLPLAAKAALTARSSRPPTVRNAA